MTETKMNKILQELKQLRGGNYVIYEYIDEYQPDCPTREYVILDNIIKEFEIKQGSLYNMFHITDSFRKLETHLRNKGQSVKIPKFYQDSYNIYMDKWKQEHPNENYEEWLKQFKEQKGKELWNKLTKNQ